MLLRLSLVLFLFCNSCVAAFADNAADASVFFAAGVQKQGTALYAGSMEQHYAELARAADYFRKALVLNPDYFDALIHLANIEAECKQWDSSLDHLEKALQLPGVSDINKAQTQNAIAYVKSQRERGVPAGSAASAVSGTSGINASGLITSTANSAVAPSGMTEAIPPSAMTASPGQFGVPVMPATVGPPVFPRPSTPLMIPSGPPFMGWTRFVDPNEHSFSMEVPAGWKSEGGLTRVSTIDKRPWVRVISPDSSVCAFVGDASLCPGYLPTATLYRTGFYPGRKYGSGLVLQYIPARKFLDKYLAMKLKSQMPDMQIVNEGSHPDLAQSINGPLGTGNARSECASVKVTGTVHGIPAVGYYICSTKLSLIAGTGMWWVTYIAGEVSTAQAENAGLAVLTHMIQTSQVDADWQRQSLSDTARFSANYRANANAISKMITDRYWSQQAANDSINQAYWHRQAVQDHAADNFSDYMRGQQTVADPTTGTQYKVQQANEHWINPMGQIMGTTGGAPDTDWRQLNNVP